MDKFLQVKSVICDLSSLQIPPLKWLNGNEPCFLTRELGESAKSIDPCQSVRQAVSSGKRGLNASQ